MATKKAAKKSGKVPAKRPVRKSAAKRGDDPLVAFCRALPGATEDVKWGADIIFSVGGRMFAGFPLGGGDPIGFKVDPMLFASMVGKSGVMPAPYMAKHSWVHVTDRHLLSRAALEALLAESHRLVAAQLSGKMRRSLGLDGS